MAGALLFISAMSQLSDGSKNDGLSVGGGIYNGFGRRFFKKRREHMQPNPLLRSNFDSVDKTMYVHGTFFFHGVAAVLMTFPIRARKKHARSYIPENSSKSMVW
jgi:hypothetical protein